MKPIVFALAACGLLAASASAAPPAMTPKDVPGGHWAAQSVQRVTDKKIMQADATGKFNGSKPVTRYELAVALDRFVRYIENGRKPLSPGPRGTARVPAAAPPDAKAALAHLADGRFLPPASPLFTKPGDKPATARELADALAQVTIRLSDRSLPPGEE